MTDLTIFIISYLAILILMGILLIAMGWIEDAVKARKDRAALKREAEQERGDDEQLRALAAIVDRQTPAGTVRIYEDSFPYLPED